MFLGGENAIWNPFKKHFVGVIAAICIQMSRHYKFKLCEFNELSFPYGTKSGKQHLHICISLL